MGEVIRTHPTIVFAFDELKNNGLVHSVIDADAVPSRRQVLVTTACGLRAIGVVKLRRGFNCTECKFALKQAAENVLDGLATTH